MVVQAFGVIAQDLENPAVRCLAAFALAQHPLELAAQRLQAGKALLDLPQLPMGDGVDVPAVVVRTVGKVQELANGVEREAELPRVPDERQAVERRLTVAALPAFRPLRFGHQPDLLVVADRRNLGPGPSRQHADAQQRRLPDVRGWRSAHGAAVGAPERQAFRFMRLLATKRIVNLQSL